jgi:2'-hydroxyisoflavone reductase
MNRRNFVQVMSATALAASVSRNVMAKDKSQRPLRILVLGGTKFLGVHIVELALKHGHSVTLFNRGKTNADLFPQLVHLKGDRDGQLNALKGKHWDVVIDDSGYVPRLVKMSAELLAHNVQRYIFISTIGVYADYSKPSNEDSPVSKMPDETSEKVSEFYGPLKALCEKAAEKAMPGRVASIRPGLIVGPRDPTDRFTYWPARAARGGEMAAPNKPGDPTQFIDARDLAGFVLRVAERRIVGTFNATSPPGMFTIGDVVSASVTAANTMVHPAPPASAVWIPGEFIAKEKYQQDFQSDFPVWTPIPGDFAGIAEANVDRALREGLTLRPVQPTVNDTLAWHLQRPAEERAKLGAGMSPEREKALLDAWRAASGGH